MFVKKTIMPNPVKSLHSVLPREGMIFVSLARQGGGGATAKLQEPGWGHMGEDHFRQSSRGGGGLLYNDKLLVFPQNASP